VFTVGAPGLDNIDKLTLLGRSAISASVGVASNCKYFVVTLHPETAAGSNAEHIIDALLSSLERFPDHQVLFTGVNADPGRETFASRISSFAANQPERVQLHASLGQVRYLSAIKHAEVVIGNSSSGIIEVPALGVPTVNIGTRQRGRLKASSIIDCAADAAAIEAAIYQALAYDDEAAYERLPYGGSGASVRIKNVLRTADLTAFRKKRFFDIPMAGVA
jgi:UDP-hydrolysing UDP-N-acetyl-D-glucosamine 2-epimerase